MAKFFRYFPKTLYTLDDVSTGLDSVTNITSRFIFEESLKSNYSIFYLYDITESDTPEIIASKIYDNPERHWLVLLFNDIIDPQFDWPLKTDDLMKYIDKKYEPNIANTSFSSGISWAKSLSNIHSYYKITTQSSIDGTTVDKMEIDAETYANTGTSTTVYTLQNNITLTKTISTEIKTYYEYEIEENEKKRNIKLLKPEFIPAIEKEFKKIKKL
jgi:hypothetical protein